MDEREEGAMRPALLADKPREYSGTESVAKKDIGPLEEAMNAHRAVISDLHGEVRLLATQLTPILQPYEGAVGSMDPDPSPPRSPHVADVIEQSERIQEAIQELRGLRSYLDVR